MRILFQGDSITDWNRRRDDPAALGMGYARMVAATLGLDAALQHEFLNRGISGNRVVDIYARIKKDIINLKPDLMSILVGVNDVGHEFTKEPNGVDAEKFFKIYCMLIEEVKAALPDIKIMIMEPFCLKGSATASTEEKWQSFSAEVPKRAAMAKRVAEIYGLTFIPLQAGFDRLCERAEPSYWLSDGVHPTKSGHEFIKREWLRAFATL